MQAILQTATGSGPTMKIATDFMGEVGLSEADLAFLNVRPREDGQSGIMWNNGLPDKECVAGPKAEEVVVRILNKLHTDEALDVQTYSLYKRFVIGEG